MKLTILTGLMFCSNSHPISMIITLIFASLLSSMLVSMFLKNSWFSLVFILVMLGGMLILFIYIASLASNEPFKINSVMYTFPFLLFIPCTQFNWKAMFNETQMFNLFSTHSGYNNFIAILYLLLTLLVVMEIIICYNAPLRSNL
uniref:NADH dehydrogenase subunit 6 n=1 Tax=Poecilochirus davydovae TaxID=3128885 RepID=UPI0030DE644E